MRCKDSSEQGKRREPRNPAHWVAVITWGVAVLLSTSAAGRAGLAADWPQFRGPGGRGVSEEKGLPRKIAKDENIAWSVPLPGFGPSSPIVVGGKVVVTAASGPHQERLHVLAFDAASGNRCWQRTIWATGPTLCNPFGGVAGPTPASDGKLLFALFSSNDLVCLDLDGNLQWFRGLSWETPGARNDSGMASSPLVAGDTLVVQMENPGTSFATGMDVLTGRTRWRVALESNACWTTPVFLPGKSQAPDLVVLQSQPRLLALELRTGKRVWAYEQPCSTISSATLADEQLLVPAGGLAALQTGSAGDGPQVLWKQRLQPINVCPVVCGNRFYIVKSGTMLVSAELSTGKTCWQLRLRGPIWATPVVADGYLYAVNHDGLVQVVRLGKDSGEVVSSCELEEGTLATPAIADGSIYIRTRSRLWKIAEPVRQSKPL